MQVDIAFDLVREVIDFEALGRSVGDEADRIAEAEGGKAELDRVRAQVAAEQDRGLVALELELARVPRLIQLPGVHEGADLGYRVRTRPPGGSRLEGHARDRRLLLDCSDRSHELIHVDAISHCHSRHQISSWPGLIGRICLPPVSRRPMRRTSVSSVFHKFPLAARLDRSVCGSPQAKATVFAPATTSSTTLAAPTMVTPSASWSGLMPLGFVQAPQSHTLP